MLLVSVVLMMTGQFVAVVAVVSFFSLQLPSLSSLYCRELAQDINLSWTNTHTECCIEEQNQQPVEQTMNTIIIVKLCIAAIQNQLAYQLDYAHLWVYYLLLVLLVLL